MPQFALRFGSATFSENLINHVLHGSTSYHITLLVTRYSEAQIEITVSDQSQSGRLKPIHLPKQ
jgi:hypothetical protein